MAEHTCGCPACMGTGERHTCNCSACIGTGSEHSCNCPMCQMQYSETKKRTEEP